jgi:hypothetical protein
MATKMKTGRIILVMFVAVILIVGLIFGIMYVTRNSVTNPDNPDSPSFSGCNNGLSVNLLAKNTLVPGTTPSVSANYSIYKGSYVGSIPSSLSKGASLDVLATATNYLNAEGKINSLACDSNDLPLNFAPYQIASYKVYDDAYTQLTDSAVGGTANLSSSTNDVTALVKISGTPLKSTGDMLFCVEYTNKTEVTTSGISLSGKGVARVDVPSWYSIAGTGSATACFSIPAIVDGGSESYDLTLSPESGQTIGAVADEGVYTTIYALQPVILDSQTGTFQTEKTWSDSLGADQTIANTDYDFGFTSA